MSTMRAVAGCRVTGAWGVALALLSGVAFGGTTIPRLPDGLAVDGDLREWTGAPVLRLGAADQVAGASRIAGDADWSAEIWVAASSAGVAVAGRVRDDHVRFATAASSVSSSDHVEVWIAFPAPELPPLGYANQFDLVEVSEGWCEAPGEGSEVEPEACLAWVGGQREWRAALGRLFVHQYLASPLGVTEAYRSAVAPAHEIPVARPCCAGARTVFSRADGGYLFELLVPAAHLPATGVMPLQSLRLLVDAVDDDEGTSRQESFVSSSRSRRFGDPATFQDVQLEAPLVYDSVPPRAGAILGASEGGFLFPAVPLEAVVGVTNPTVGYQYAPSEPSPALERVPLDVGPAIATCGSVSLHRAARAHGTLGTVAGLVVAGGGKVLGEAELQSRCWHYDPERVVRRSFPPCEQVLFLCPGIASITGSGMCGACPTVDVEVVALSPDGTVTSRYQGVIAPRSGNEIDVSVPAGDGPIVFRYVEIGDAGEDVPVTLELRWTATDVSLVDMATGESVDASL